MNRREFALGKRIKSYELGFVGPLFIAAFPGGMILPFYVYLFGAGVFWEYVGIIICMALVWNYSSYKLMRYAKRHKSICTLPGFLKHRFKDDKDYLRIIMSVETVVLSIIIMSLIIKELGIIIFETFNIDCTIAEFCAAVIPAAIICVFGYSAIAKTAPYKATFMLAVVVIISVHAYFDQGIRTLVRNMMAMDVTGSVSDYMNVMYHNGRFLAFEDYVSLISMGLLALGMPFMLTTFFSVDNSDKINNGKIIMIVFLPIFFVSAAIMGGISRGYMYPHKGNLPETFFYEVPYPGGGWATWKRAWMHFSNDIDELFAYWSTRWREFNKFGGDYLQKQLVANKNGQMYTWFIKWHGIILREGGLTLYPHTSLTNNIGFDGTGVNCSAISSFDIKELAKYISVKRIPIQENKRAARIIYHFYSGYWFSKRYRKQWLSRIKKLFHK